MYRQTYRRTDRHTDTNIQKGKTVVFKIKATERTS